MRQTKVSRHTRKTKRGRTVVRKHARHLKNRSSTYIKNMVFAEKGSPFEKLLMEERYKLLREKESKIRTMEDRDRFAKEAKELLSEPYSIQIDKKIGSAEKPFDIGEEVFPLTSVASEAKLVVKKGGKAKIVPTDIKPKELYPAYVGFNIGEKSILSSKLPESQGEFMKFKPVKEVLMEYTSKPVERIPSEIKIDTSELTGASSTEGTQVLSSRSPVAAKRAKQ